MSIEHYVSKPPSVGTLLALILLLGPAPGAMAQGPDTVVLSDPQVITAEESRDRDYFGYAIDVSGNTAMFSSVADEHPYLYVYEFDGSAWSNAATIQPDLAEFKPQDLALDGDVLVTGRRIYDDPEICTVEEPNCNTGIVLLYERDSARSNEWVFRKHLDGYRVPHAQFGGAMQVDGDVIVVSAASEDVASPVVMSGHHLQASTQAIENAGAIYIYERDAGGPQNWGLVQRIEQETPYVDSFFGSDPLLAGDTLILNEMRSGGYKTGVIIYQRQPGELDAWIMTQRIPLPSYRIDSLAFDGTTLVHSHFDEVSLVNSYQFFERDRTGQFVLVQEFEKARPFMGWGSLTIQQGVMVERAGDGDLVGRTFEKNMETGLWEEAGELRYVGFNSPDPDSVRHLALDGGRLLVKTWRDEFRGEVLAYELAPAVNAGHMGGWFNPDTPGQGVLVDVDEAHDFLFGAWFTYPLDSSANPHEQHWFTAQGNYAGNKSELTVYESLGGRFDDSAVVETLPVGTATLSFTDCASGVLSYRIDTLGLRGDFPLVRLLPGSETTCENRQDIQSGVFGINPGMNGGWYDDQTSGQGFLIDTLPDGAGGGFIFVAWFTYGETAHSGQRWLTAQGNFAGAIADITVYESTGGSFDTALLPSTDPVGSMQIDFTDCDTATLSYQLDEGASGTIPLARLLPTANALCKELTGED